MSNEMRHEYRQLSDAEKETVKEIKILGDAFLELLKRTPPGRCGSIAATKMEEAVMWAVKHVTG